MARSSPVKGAAAFAFPAWWAMLKEKHLLWRCFFMVRSPPVKGAAAFRFPRLVDNA